MTLTRKTPLQRHTPLQGGAPMRRTPMPRQVTPLAQRKGTKLALPELPTKRKPRPAGPTSETVLKVLQRDRSRCVVCGHLVVGERGWDWSIHHRRGRDGRPDSHTLANLILVCGADNQSGCHGLIHQRRSIARPNGWWLSRAGGEDPLLVPIRYQGRAGLIWLTPTGISPTPPLEVAA